MHPEIPSEMSDRAKHFILRCFEPDPDRRAAAAELMDDNFLSELVLWDPPLVHSLLTDPVLLQEEEDGSTEFNSRIQPQYFCSR